jgi:hypothetical protein
MGEFKTQSLNKLFYQKLPRSLAGRILENWAAYPDYPFDWLGNCGRRLADLFLRDGENRVEVGDDIFRLEYICYRHENNCIYDEDVCIRGDMNCIEGKQVCICDEDNCVDDFHNCKNDQ